MYSLYHSLLAQHPRQLMPVPCAASTIAQLHRYFELRRKMLGLPDMAARLLSAGAHVHATDAQGRTALHCAAMYAFTARERARVVRREPLLEGGEERFHVGHRLAIEQHQHALGADALQHHAGSRRVAALRAARRPHPG